MPKFSLIQSSLRSKIKSRTTTFYVTTLMWQIVNSRENFVISYENNKQLITICRIGWLWKIVICNPKITGFHSLKLCKDDTVGNLQSKAPPPTCILVMLPPFPNSQVILIPSFYILNQSFSFKKTQPTYSNYAVENPSYETRYSSCWL